MLHASRYVMHILSVFILTVGLLPAQVTAADDGGDSNTTVLTAMPPPAVNFGDAVCLECHADSGKAIMVQDEADEDATRALRAIDHTGYLKGAHGDMACVECHNNIVDVALPHQKNETPDPDCAGCHQDLWQHYQEQELTDEAARMGIVVQNIEAYEDSYHAKPAKVGFKASCDDCHHSHEFNVPPRGSLKRTEWHLTIPEVCAQCHEAAYEDYSKSKHGDQVLVKKNPRAAVCTDCHTSHDITTTRRDPFQLSITKMCGDCHKEKFETYRATYHGQINTLGYTYTAKCYDCHGSHVILPVTHPDSTIHPDNRLETCEECHDGDEIMAATESLMTFGPHANTYDYEKYPQMYIAAKFMHGLLLFVFAYFWLHSLLWWFKEYRDRKAGRTLTHVRTDELEVSQTKQVRRFGLIWRIGHLFFAISVMVLILTGMALYYAYTAWAPVVIEAFGGPEMAGLVHRISAAIMLGIFFLHLIAVSINIYRKRSTFRWFGPDSLVPNWKDFKDAWAMFKWFVNKGERPTFDRWTYWEKFDYWAVFWGMAVIGGSGMMLSFPEITAQLFPGWVFNVVMLVHGEEAFLAAVFLFTVHFFNNHFRPDKMPPPDVVMFTGSQSLEEFKRDHRAQYDRLVENGELERYLMDLPSKPMTIGSKLLGLFLIACGLTLLVIVAIGFFGGYTPE